MAKRFIIFIITAVVLLWIIGCTEPARQPAESAKIEAPIAKPPEANLPKTEPVKPKPKTAASFHDKCVEILKTYIDDKGMVDQLAARIMLQEYLDSRSNT